MVDTAASITSGSQPPSLVRQVVVARVSRPVPLIPGQPPGAVPGPPSAVPGPLGAVPGPLGATSGAPGDRAEPV